MTNWDESQHPRDDEGKFTYKNGGSSGGGTNSSSESRANTLYGGVTKQNNVQNERNRLINELGDKLSRADILYATVDELREMKKKLQSESEDENISLKQKVVEYLLGKGYNDMSFAGGNIVFGSDTMGMVDLAHKDRKNPDYASGAIELKNYNDPRIASDKEYLTKKVKEQFKDYNFNPDEIKGYFFKVDSEPSIRMSQDKDFREMIKNNKENLKNGKEFSGNFSEYSDKKESNWHYALGHYDVRNSYIDKMGNLRLKVYDTYDFNKQNKSVFNQAGRRKMIDGTLTPFFTIHDIIVPKSELDKLWGKN